MRRVFVHGDIFADEWYRSAVDSGALSEACAATRLVMSYSAITDEICERTFNEVRQAISDAFVRVATEVLDREREREK